MSDAGEAAGWRTSSTQFGEMLAHGLEVQIQPNVASLAKIGDDYDALAFDVATQSTSDQLKTILKAYQQISSGHYTATNVFWDDVTQVYRTYQRY